MAEFITGNAGTGKSTLVRARCDEGRYGILTGTTGVAAVNQGVVTLHSTLRFFDTADLQRKFTTGKLMRTIDDLYVAGALGHHLVIDEVSMLDADALDIIHNAVRIATRGNVDLVLTGDFAQLPPVSPGKFTFMATCWPEYEAHTTRLTKVWRQDDLPFLDALNLIRRGDKAGADALFGAGAVNTQFLDPNFSGITLVPTNAEADHTNAQRFALVDNPLHPFSTTQVGTGPAEWKQIPATIEVKVGARVMVICNDPAFAYANGDTGLVTSIAKGYVHVLLDRTGGLVAIGDVTRKHFEYTDGRPRLVGTINFMPLKIAYALTIHKSQGLTLPSVQIHVRHQFAGSPALMYVATSRVRTASNVTIVGPRDVFRSRINCHPEVMRYL